MSILEFLLRGVIFAPWNPELYPPVRPEDLMVSRIWNYLGRAVFSALFVFMFTRGYEGRPGIGEGLRYGLLIGLLVFVPGLFGSMITTTVSAGMLVVRCAASILEMLVCGVLVAMIYRGQKKAAA
jgi:hypothetical protein